MGQQLIIRWSVQQPQESTSDREIEREREREQDRVSAKIKSGIAYHQSESSSSVGIAYLSWDSNDHPMDWQKS
jgi:hypothetical protein